MSKDNPKNKMEAFTHQFQETTKLLMSLALMGEKSEYNSQLKLLKEQIKVYEYQTGN